MLLPSTKSSPTAPTRPAARDGQWPAATCTTKPSNQSGTAGSSRARFAARVKGRLGWDCQHALHMPFDRRLVVAPHFGQVRGGSGVGPVREQLPHHPVGSRSLPGRPHRGHGDCADWAAARRRQARHKVSVRRRTRAPQSAQSREHVAHRPVPASSTRSWPHRGHRAFAAASRSVRVHRQHKARSRYPTGAPQRAQSRCRLPIPPPTAAAWSGRVVRWRPSWPAGLAAAGRGWSPEWCRRR